MTSSTGTELEEVKRMDEIDGVRITFVNQDGIKDESTFKVEDVVPAMKGTGMDPKDTWRIKKIEVK